MHAYAYMYEEISINVTQFMTHMLDMPHMCHNIYVHINLTHYTLFFEQVTLIKFSIIPQFYMTYGTQLFDTYVCDICDIRDMSHITYVTQNLCAYQFDLY